jgi:7-cyano-7-deazaguanine synthase
VAEHRIVRLPDLREASEIGGRVLVGHPPTYIPLRNAVFYSAAASFAEEIGAGIIVGGHNKDDLKVFRDTRPGFFGHLQRALRAGSGGGPGAKVRILRPLEGKSKVDVVKTAARIGVPLGMTWSCHGEGSTHCWECEGCLSRIEAFERAGVPDPLRPVPAGKIS